jgi:hypothetical protein
MTLSPKMLSIIQKAGTAVFNADVALKAAVSDCAKKVRNSMTDNPFDVGDADLYENWKTVARISQAMTAIEAELQKVHAMALSRPVITAKAPLQLLASVDVTDAVVKRGPRKLKAAKKAGARTAKKATSRARGSDRQDNTARVLTHLQTVLNADSFVKLNQSAVAIAVGVPKGSIGASTKKLLKDGKLIQGERGQFKLA